MSEITKEKLINLKYALKREIIYANQNGSYASTSIIGCNTRKYHGLLVKRFEDGTRHVLVSELEETITQHGDSFRLGIRRYINGKYDPHGHRYAIEFDASLIPERVYRVGGVILKKQFSFSKDEDRILLKYTIQKATSATTLKLQPFLPFRNIHSLSKANMNINTKVKETDNGIRIKPYENYPEIFMQLSRKNKFVAAPDWYYNIEYSKEIERGYENTEDVFVPGYFELNVKEGDEIIFSAGLSATNSKTLKRKFTAEVKKATLADNFESNLKKSARQFFLKTKSGLLPIAGFHWYDFQYREALISIFGLTYGSDDTKLFDKSFGDIIKKFKKEKSYITPDIPLLFIRVIQQLTDYTEKHSEIWKKYGRFVLSLIKDIKSGKYGTELHENGLLYIPDSNIPVTWMNEYTDGKPVTKRDGYVVEINALWYNALKFAISNSKTQRDAKKICEQIEQSFTEIFWNNTDNNLFDYVNGEINTDIRPNQIFAISLPYSPLETAKQKYVLDNIKKNLLTQKGLRTLSPENPKYNGFYQGNEHERALAKHQGVIHPWLIGQYCDAYINIFNKSGLNVVKEIYKNFENEIFEHGIGTIAETFDANPPNQARGAVSYAPSVGELLRIKLNFDKIENI